jgi:hypothetical protein
VWTGVVGTALASLVAVPVYGPEAFIRDAGAPRSEVREFTLMRRAQSYVMQVQNGSVDQTNLVSSAVIAVNGVTIFKQNQFSQRTCLLESPITLGMENQLSVKINSIPSSYVMLTILGYYEPEDVDDDEDGFTENEGDCEDLAAAVYPGAQETCDAVDNDCDGVVDEGCLERIAVAPETLALIGLGRTQQLAVTGHYAGGSSADLTPSAAGTTYQCDAPAVATVTSEGLVTAVGVGIARVTATNEGVSSGVRVTVTTMDDADGDGVADVSDGCLGTIIGEPADARGCSARQAGDSDGDGVSNYVEERLGTDPASATDVPVVRALYGYNARGGIESARPSAGVP